jgi:NADPH2:quinone reductase
MSGINPVDVKRRAGGRGPLASARVVPHFDGAGVIDQVGSGVSESRIGERVWVYEAQWQRASGTAAEYVVVSADRAVRLPDGVDVAAGASLGIPALTAHRCVFADEPVSGATVLVTGGAGAGGSYAIQFAKLDGARVITTVSTEEKAELARKAGADLVINYKTEDTVARVKQATAGNGVDRIVEVELGGNLSVSVEVLKANGVLATYASQAVPEPVLPFYQLLYRNIVLRHELVFLMPEDAKQHAVTDITGWLEAGRLWHHIGSRFPLDQAAAAHEAVESGAVGKVLLEINSDL